jgi:hypothetical protein
MGIGNLSIVNAKGKLSLRGAKRRGNLMRLLQGVYPELINEILRFAQNDKKRRVRNALLQSPQPPFHQRGLRYIWSVL